MPEAEGCTVQKFGVDDKVRTSAVASRDRRVAGLPL